MQLMFGAADAPATLVPQPPSPHTRGGNVAASAGVALFGVDVQACKALMQACHMLGLCALAGPDAWQVDATSGRAVAALVLVYGATADVANRHLADTCRAFGACRVILVGPEFGSPAAEEALTNGFDEVWPAAMPQPLCLVLLQRAWQTATQLLASDAARTLRVGPLAVGQHGSQCTYYDRAVHLGRDSLALLKALVMHYPHPIDRATVLDAMGKEGDGLALHSRAIDMAVTRLRQRLRVANVQGVQVSTVRGVGYGLAVA